METSTITFDSIYATVGAVTRQRENDLEVTLKGMGANASVTDMLMMQQQLQQWSLFTQIQSTIIKELSDAMKGVIQKAS